MHSKSLDAPTESPMRTMLAFALAALLALPVRADTAGPTAATGSPSTLSFGTVQPLNGPVTVTAPKPVMAPSCGQPILQQGAAFLALTALSYSGPRGHETLTPDGSAGAAYVIGVGLFSTAVNGECVPRLQFQAAFVGSLGISANPSTESTTVSAAFRLTPAGIIGFRLTGPWLVEAGVGFDALNAGGATSGFLTRYSSIDNLHVYFGLVCVIPDLSSSTPLGQSNT